MSTDSRPASDRPLGASLGWRQINRRYLFQSPWYSLRQDELVLPNGSTAQFTFVEHPGFVSIVPVLQDGRVVLIRSYRYPVDEWVLEVPAGGLGSASKHPALTVDRAHAELLEETGYVADSMDRVGAYWSAIGNSRCRAHVFLASGLRSAAAQSLEPTEHIDIVPTPMADAVAMARDGRIQDGHSALALLMCEPHMRRGPALRSTGPGASSIPGTES